MIKIEMFLMTIFGTLFKFFEKRAEKRREKYRRIIAKGLEQACMEGAIAADRVSRFEMGYELSHEDKKVLEKWNRDRIIAAYSAASPKVKEEYGLLVGKHEELKTRDEWKEIIAQKKHESMPFEDIVREEDQGQKMTAFFAEGNIPNTERGNADETEA